MSIKFDEKKAVIRFTDPILGSLPADPEVYDRWIQAKALKEMTKAGIPEEEALAKIDEEKGLVTSRFDPEKDNGLTAFPRNEDGVLGLFDYQIRGFFKDSCELIRKSGQASESKKLKNYTARIDGGIFVKERFVPFFDPASKLGITDDLECFGYCDRPLRAQTLQGPRICLAHSEQLNAGLCMEFTIQVADTDWWPAVQEWLEYGKYHGLGQWRNSGKGRFELLSLG